MLQETSNLNSLLFRVCFVSNITTKGVTQQIKIKWPVQFIDWYFKEPLARQLRSKIGVNNLGRLRDYTYNSAEALSVGVKNRI